MLRELMVRLELLGLELELEVEKAGRGRQSSSDFVLSDGSD
jgi:hypothetical protein